MFIPLTERQSCHSQQSWKCILICFCRYSRWGFKTPCQSMIQSVREWPLALHTCWPFRCEQKRSNYTHPRARLTVPQCSTKKNLILNNKKTKEIVVDFRKMRRPDPGSLINSEAVGRVSNDIFLGTHITKNFSWATHTSIAIGKPNNVSTS